MSFTYDMKDISEYSLSFTVDSGEVHWFLGGIKKGNDYITEDLNGKIVKFSDIKRIEKSYSSKYSNDFDPFHMVKKGAPVFKLLGLIPIKFAEKDCLILDSFCNGRNGGYYSKYGIFVLLIGRFIPGGVRNVLFMSALLPQWG